METKRQTLAQVDSFDQPEALEQLTKKVAKGAGIAFNGSIIGGVLLYISLLVVARLLGAELLGIYVLGYTIFSFSALLARIGLDSGALRYISIYNEARDKNRIKGILVQCFLVSFLAGLGIGIVSYFGSEWIATTIFKIEELDKVIRIFSFGIPFMAVMVVAATATRGFQKMQYFVYIINIFQPLTKLCLIFIFYWAGLELYGVVWATVISAVLGLLFATIFYIKRVFPELISNIRPLFETKKLLEFSIPMFFIALVGFFFVGTDVLLLGYFHSPSEVGIYRAASQISLLLMMVLSALSSIFTPIVAELYNKKEMDKLNSIFKIVTRWGFYICLPIFLIMIFLSKEILSLFGSQFIGAWYAFIILAFAYFIHVSLGDVGWVLAMCGRQKLWFYIIITAAALNIGANFLLIPKFGITGAAVATGISMVGLHLVGLVAVRYLLKLFPFDNRHLKGLAAGIVTCIFALVLKTLDINQHPIIFPLFFSFSIVGCYILMLFVFQLNEEDKTIIKIIRKKVVMFSTGNRYATK
jgi:O-antigen/teichoic acid export membrane protein